ncbi:fimbrial protein, partial [Acinetobacter baumannii]
MLYDQRGTLPGEFKHEVRQFQKPYDNQQAEQISLMV